MEALLISALIALVVFCVFWWLSGMVPHPLLQQIVRVILVVIAALWLIRHIAPLVRMVF
jgi:hypothetical protein